MADFEPDFDAIVVGAGLAGSVAAYELAKAGKSVLVVERGNFAGAKNMTGGRIYAHSLHSVFPDMDFSELPFERKVSHERISLMAPDSNFTIDFTSEDLTKDGQESYTILRAVFDPWLAEQAENEGAEIICGIPVEDLLKDEDGSVTGTAGKIYGVRAGEDEMTASVVILADGVNSLLTEKAVGYKRPEAKFMAVGVKEVYELSEQRINDLFQVADGEGAAWLFAGDVTHGLFGGGIIYTNKDSISIGIVAGIEAIANGATRPVYQMLEDLKAHPAVAPVLKDAKMVEHSGHMVPEGGINMMPELTGDGVIVAGDAAMMCVNLGYTVRGMDYAVAAGQYAGQAAVEALDAGDTSKSGLAGYVNRLNNSFVLKDLNQFKLVPGFMEGFDRMFCGYPEMIRDMMNKMFVIDGTPVQPMKKTMMPIVKEVGFMNLFKDVRGAMKAL
ncbi:FAD-dependent oxidoreductase [Slackia heliotrinireducens]|uniref:Flavin-dependent dehydrogenase n=1 Tax=Slackia heliotrinireducens (strain ATCC 29202 / DSM 20476 / NCTC 11029 / RHS 1) TaxID=471855 RepID=C7N4Y1_SLAHD|nr:FAD-dependent oxidoreductase [Slackia heliotrinireducens]ACV21966.1 flavin-dependent dehydrogenase [Slackia heliotrinireducens DSM 20476]VEG99830.1 Electron transfer flavoprotein-ubiquinone oxidoreductase [Slackia heliotrinireducens]